MSSVTKNAIDGYSSIGRRLNEFLYDGRVKDNVKREHTKEELEQMLEDIRQECWENYSQGAKGLGWV